MDANFNVASATTVDSVAQQAVADMFEYRSWTDDQKMHGDSVKRALSDAILILIQHVPPSADRTSAIRKIREASWAANCAISHGGIY